MPSTTPLTDAINALTQYANDTTGQSDTTLSDAVGTLVAGYGGGGSELIYNWDLTQSLTDTVHGITATITNSTQDSSGVHLSAANAYLQINNAFLPNSSVTYEIDISASSRQGTGHGRLFSTTYNGYGFIYRNTGKWAAYFGTWQESSITDANYFAGHTLKVVYAKTGVPSLYRDNELILTWNGPPQVGLWGVGSSSASFYNLSITAIRIYTGDTTK